MQQSRVSRNKVHTEYANLSINLAIKQDAFSNIFVLSHRPVGSNYRLGGHTLQIGGGGGGGTHNFFYFLFFLGG